jgi:hypothetical protein
MLYIVYDKNFSYDGQRNFSLQSVASMEENAHTAAYGDNVPSLGDPAPAYGGYIPSYGEQSRVSHYIDADSVMSVR